ncbi:hypothetical protein [Streptacidiphilus sp. PAMC 29251]
MAVGRWMVAVSGMVVLVVWTTRRQRADRERRSASREHRKLVSAADWTVRRARSRADRAQTMLVTVDEVLVKAMEDFGLTQVTREHAAAVLRERLAMLGGRADIVTDADLDPLPYPRTACAGHRPLWGTRRRIW